VQHNSQTLVIFEFTILIVYFP